jgi:tetratricopeptide (TPR) repeat protein
MSLFVVEMTSAAGHRREDAKGGRALRRIAVVALGIMGLSMLTSAASADDRDACTGTGDTAACSRAIDGGQWRGRDLADLYVARGTAYLARVDYGQALADFNAAIKIDPNNAAAYRARGEVAHFHPDIAIADFDTAIRLDPNDAKAYIDRGAAYRASGQLDRAIADFDTAIRRDPKAAAAYTGRGLARRAKGELDQAIADYDEAIKIDPQGRFVHLDRGAAYQAKGDLDRAIVDYDEEIRLGPVTRAYELRAGAYRQKGDLDRAIADAGEAIRRNPDDAVALRERALVRQAKGDAAGAAADLDAARRLTTVLGVPIPAFTALHATVGTIGVLSGLVVLVAMLGGRSPRAPTALFLGASALSSASGLLFHHALLTPAFTLGVAALAAAALATLAFFGGRLAGHWRPIYIVAAVAALWLNIHVGVEQALVGLAPSYLFFMASHGLDLSFAILRMAIAAMFAALAIIALLRFRPRASAAG